MRLLPMNRERRCDLRWLSRKARVVAGFRQRTIEPGGLNLKNVRLVAIGKSRIQRARDALAKRNVSAAWTIEHNFERMRITAMVRRMRNDFDVRECGIVS